MNTLLDPGSLELRDRAKEPSDESARRGAGVDSLAEGYEGDSARLPFVQEEDQVSKVASEAIEFPADDGLNFVPTHVGHQAIERRPTVFGAADPLVNVFDG